MAVSVNSSLCGMNKLLETRLRRSSSSWLNRKNSVGLMSLGITSRENHTVKVKASWCLNPIDQPILKEAIKEPVAFMGGMFAGLLRLDLDEEPLKEWVTRTVEASGITIEDIDAEGSKQEVPQQIEIE